MNFDDLFLIFINKLYLYTNYCFKSIILSSISPQGMLLAFVILAIKFTTDNIDYILENLILDRQLFFYR